MWGTEGTADWTDSKRCRTCSRRISIASDPRDTRTKSCDAGTSDFRVVSPARTGKEKKKTRVATAVTCQKTVRATHRVRGLNSFCIDVPLSTDEKVTLINRRSFNESLNAEDLT